MKKKTAIFISLILAAVLAFGACAVKGDLTLPEEHDDAELPAVASPAPMPNNNASIVVMEVQGIEVTKDQFEQTFQAILQQSGVSADDPIYGPILKESAIDLLLSQKVIEIKLKELGYMDLSDEDMQLANDQAQSELDYMTLNAMETIIAGLPENYSDEELDAAVLAYEDDLLAQYSLTREDYLNYFTEAIALENAKAELLKDAVPSDEEVSIQYENSVEADKQAIGDDLAVYETYLMQNQQSYYIPEGIRYVRHVLISFDSELSANIRTLRQEGDDEAADTARKEALATIQEESEGVLKQIQDGDISFTEAIEEFGEDPGMEMYTEGYEIYEGCALYMQEFTDGAMSLETKGDITGLVATDYGYHIIEYSSDRAAGPIPLDTVQQSIYDSLLATISDQAWQTLINEWKSTIEYTVFDEAL